MPPPSWRLQHLFARFCYWSERGGGSGTCNLLGKRHFCWMRLFCTLEKHACLKQNEKENVEMDLAEMPTSDIALKESFKESKCTYFCGCQKFLPRKHTYFLFFLANSTQPPRPPLPPQHHMRLKILWFIQRNVDTSCLTK